MNESLIQLEAGALTVAIILGIAWLICRLGFRGAWATKDTGDKWCDTLLVAYFLAWPLEAAVVYCGWKAFEYIANRVFGDAVTA